MVACSLMLRAALAGCQTKARCSRHTDPRKIPDKAQKRCWSIPTRRPIQNPPVRTPPPIRARWADGHQPKRNRLASVIPLMSAEEMGFTIKGHNFHKFLLIDLFSVSIFDRVNTSDEFLFFKEAVRLYYKTAAPEQNGKHSKLKICTVIKYMKIRYSKISLL